MMILKIDFLKYIKKVDIMKKILKNDWEFLNTEFEKPYYKNLRNILKNEYMTKTVYPPMECIFNALHITPFKDVKVVILGQDPYHQKGQAHGLSFSVNKNIKIPPSLQNIYKELNSDLGLKIANNGFLEKWAKQGVLLLNTTLTVVESMPNSHQNIGWSNFTDEVILSLNKKETPVVFIFWGNNAISKQNLITNKNHLILKSPHPSPLSANRGFFGSKPFSKTNEFLKQHGLKEIDWQIEDI